MERPRRPRVGGNHHQPRPRDHRRPTAGGHTAVGSGRPCRGSRVLARVAYSELPGHPSRISWPLCSAASRPHS